MDQKPNQTNQTKPNNNNNNNNNSTKASKQTNKPKRKTKQIKELAVYRCARSNYKSICAKKTVTADVIVSVAIGDDEATMMMKLMK